MSDNWFSTGYGKVEEEAAKSGGTDFWVRQGESARIRFLVEEPVTFRQHNPRIDGQWRRYTCRQGMSGGCPLCEAKNPNRFVGVFTVYDYGERKDDSGKVTRVPAGVKSYVQGIRVLRVLTRLHDRQGGLMAQDFEIMRVGTGSDTVYNFLPQPPTDFPAEARNPDGSLKVINAREKFAPATVEELAAAARALGGRPEGTSPPTGAQSSDDDSRSGDEVFSSGTSF